MFNKSKTIGCLLLAALLSSTAHAQLSKPNASGVSIGHQHLFVADVAKSRDMWLAFGAKDVSNDKLKNIFAFPGVLIMLREQKDKVIPSGETVANHVAFSVKDYAGIKAKVASMGGKVILDNPNPGQLLADMPDGVRVEFLGAPDQAEAIKFHHLHVQAADLPPLRDWYVKVFGADVGERAGMPSAVMPEGRVDFLAARGATPKPSAGGAIDHFGFEVADMAAFKKRVDSLGIKFDREPEKRDDLGLTIAFITDPVGTRIEITQGMGGLGKK